MTDHNITPPTFFTRETGLSVLRFEGEDATDFLNSQITTALEDERGKAACPAALANPKGQVLAVFNAWPVNGGWHIAIPTSEADWLIEHLKRFVFRAKVRITPCTETAVIGLSGPHTREAIEAAGLSCPPNGGFVCCGDVDIIGLTGSRFLLSGPADSLERIAQEWAEYATAGHASDWTRSRINAGEVELCDDTRARFLPQMLGLIELGAVSANKGCYPGQEIIARARRGRVKRGLMRMELDESWADEALDGESIEHDGKRLDVLDSVRLSHGKVLVQAVAPL